MFMFRFFLLFSFLFLRTYVYAEPLSCHELVDSNPAPSDSSIVLGRTVVHWSRPFEELQPMSLTLTGDPQIFITEMQALQKPNVTLEEFIPRLFKMISYAEEDSAQPWLKDFILMGKLLHQSDLTFLNVSADRMVDEKNFDDWINMMLVFQKNYLTSVTAKQPDGLDSYREKASWVGFTQRMGFLPEETIKELFQQRDLDWISTKSLRKHFKKRLERNELDIQSEEELLAFANHFLRSERADQILYRNQNGLIFKYDTTTKEMAIISADGKIITYYVVIDAYRKNQSLNYFLGHAFLGLPYEE